MKRREFIKKSTAAGVGLVGTGLFDIAMPKESNAIDTGEGIGIEEGLYILDSGKEKNTMPRVRPEILNNPRAVFLIETHVAADRDNRGFYTEARSQIEDAGHMAVQSLFVKGGRKGGSTIISPNMTTVSDSVLSPVVGIITSPDFMAGFVEELREIGNTNVIAGERGGGLLSRRKTGVYDIFDRHDIKLIEARYLRYSDYNKNELNWHKVPGKPMVMKRVPTFRPIGDKDNMFINMPKLKCHNLGLTTLSIKNLQGTVPQGYGHYCNRWATVEYMANNSYGTNFKRDFVKHYYENVEAAFLKHRAEGYKHWDYEKAYPLYEKKGGWQAFRKIKGDVGRIKAFMDGIPANLMWDETWSQRAIDSASAIQPAINIVEGIIGRDGNGFSDGADHLCNYIIAGLSMPEVDSVGSYIMGQDSRELYYTRIAKERGLGENDPEKIDIYLIKGNDIVPVKDLSEIRRVPLGVNLHSGRDKKRLFW